jgi:hypothetical protein
MNNVGWLGLGAVMSSLLAGCGAPVEGESDAADAPHAAEDVGSVQEALGARDVGVIPVETNACPAGTEVSFRLDVEDGEDLVIGCEPGPEGGYISRWVTRDVVWNQAPIASYMCGGNFTMRFCRVDGTQFKKLLWANQSTAYAVLQLGSSCPDGGISVGRYMDMEDDDNTNTSSGSLAPSVIDRNANLKFCLFGSTLGGNGPYMSSFPLLNGLQYAVFHDFDLSPQQTWVMSKRFIFSDDEDNANENSRDPSTGAAAVALATMIEGTTDTWFDIARVR